MVTKSEGVSVQFETDSELHLTSLETNVSHELYNVEVIEGGQGDDLFAECLESSLVGESDPHPLNCDFPLPLGAEKAVPE